MEMCPIRVIVRFTVSIVGVRYRSTPHEHLND